MFSQKYEKFMSQLAELNRQKKRGFDVSVVMASFVALAGEIDDEWVTLNQEERSGFEDKYLD